MNRDDLARVASLEGRIDELEDELVIYEQALYESDNGEPIKPIVGKYGFAELIEYKIEELEQAYEDLENIFYS